MSSNRIHSIDAFRVLAILAVIAIHTTPFGEVENNQTYTVLYVAINQLARFAVPFFFVISGYFFARKINGGSALLPSAIYSLKRLAIIWLFFSVVYVFPYDLIKAFEYGLLGPVKVFYWNLVTIEHDPVKFLFQGSKVHLWFLVSLALSIIITSLFLRYFQPNPLPSLITFSVVIYVFGLLAKSYADTPYGVDIDFNTRNGPFFSTVFFVMGYVLSYIKLNPSYLFYGLLVTIVGYAIQAGEIYYLYHSYSIDPTSHDYVVGTLLVGLGVSLMALSNHPFLNIRSISGIGRYTLGIYGIHFIFVDMLRHFDQKVSNPSWELIYVLIVFLLSVIVTVVLSRNKKLKKVFV
ncbi:MAG: acyltransferase family protein [Candidatus Thiodiazotropha taylori]|nr:acyltransferase family protein [Candidatus Thiodiazotropha taylori]